MSYELLNKMSDATNGNRTAGDGSQSDNIHVVTENGEQCFMWTANQLTYIAQDRHELPPILATKFGHLATRLDLSYNSLTSFKGINLFTCLNELILDNNNFDDDQLDFRLNLRLKTLSLNKNKLTNLYKLINNIRTCFPNLEYLSLIGNPLCPGPLLNGSNRADKNNPNKESFLPSTKILNGGIRIDELELDAANHPKTVSASEIGIEIAARKRVDFNVKKYRHFIIYHLPNLRFLDSKPVTLSERDEALKRCFWMSQATLNQLNGHFESGNSYEYFSETTDGFSGRQNDLPERFGEVGLSEDNQEQSFQLSIMTDNNNVEQPKGIFSRLAYRYTGRNSEGNRFIRNQDL